MARSKLGNDPFRRGAAPREAVEPKAKRRPAAPDPEPTPVESAPVESAPVESAPVEAAPVESAPVEAAPVESAPVATSPEPAPEPLPEPAVGAPAVSDVITPEDVPQPSVQAAAERAPDVGETDAFGRDPAFAARALELLGPIYRRYFRVEARGVGNVPAQGPVILVANHSGAVPWDVVMLAAATGLDHPARRVLRPLVEDFAFHFPFLGVALNRFGAVRACQENAEALLARGEAVAVFPEGAKGLGKPFAKRYRLQRFGRGGFVKLALRTGAPVVPVAIVGAEETHPVLARLVRPAAALGLPYLPVTPTFPWLGALGLLPLPTKWTIEFGEPVRLSPGPSGEADELTVGRLAEELRSDIQGRLDRLLKQRRGVFG